MVCVWSGLNSVVWCGVCRLNGVTVRGCVRAEVIVVCVCVN